VKYECERKGIRYEWSVIHSGYGMVWGKAWTREGARRKARKAWGAMLAGEL
jgi:hypothetical protein